MNHFAVSVMRRSSPLAFIRCTATGHFCKRGSVHFRSIVSAITPPRKGKNTGDERTAEGQRRTAIEE